MTLVWKCDGCGELWVIDNMTKVGDKILCKKCSGAETNKPLQWQDQK